MYLNKELIKNQTYTNKLYLEFLNFFLLSLVSICDTCTVLGIYKIKTDLLICSRRLHICYLLYVKFLFEQVHRWLIFFSACFSRHLSSRLIDSIRVLFNTILLIASLFKKVCLNGMLVVILLKKASHN